MAELAGLSLFSDGNLQAYYKLENVNDSKGSNNLTNNNSVAFSAAKYNNGADGGSSNSTKNLNVTNNLGYTGSSYSIFFWVKMNTEIGSSEQHFLNLADTTSDTTFQVAYEYNGGTRRIVFHRIKHGVADTTLTSNQTLGTSAFHHVGFSYDGTTLTGYFDNTSVGTLSSNGNGVTNISTNFTLLSDRNNSLYASSIIDDVACFNRTLTTDEIAALYNESLVSGGAFLYNII